MTFEARTPKLLLLSRRFPGTFLALPAWTWGLCLSAGTKWQTNPLPSWTCCPPSWLLLGCFSSGFSFFPMHFAALLVRVFFKALQQLLLGCQHFLSPFGFFPSGWVHPSCLDFFYSVHSSCLWLPLSCCSLLARDAFLLARGASLLARFFFFLSVLGPGFTCFAFPLAKGFLFFSMPFGKGLPMPTILKLFLT